MPSRGRGWPTGPRESSLRWNLLLDPSADHVEHLPAVVLEHHEVAVAEDAAVFQLQIFSVAPGVIEKRNHRGPLRPSRALRRDEQDRDADQILQLARRRGNLRRIR